MKCSVRLYSVVNSFFLSGLTVKGEGKDEILTPLPKQQDAKKKLIPILKSC